ncbi:hypothetical protein NZD89_09175 [Alicyclobacillus fastidiosus]|uniref:Uncharacterized protein n=1 Tax=Alicyclobacillus fastidiosus TaxID=392011 RepID=A0ABY6ZKS7_9BACL|nr:hypothetical protein [Alicyclobacillus fastidiosus]WAH43530.1 hypothetical protein NZD89_09175 [Alicyclobacillus fastidiosus]
MSNLFTSELPPEWPKSCFLQLNESFQLRVAGRRFVVTRPADVHQVPLVIHIVERVPLAIEPTSRNHVVDFIAGRTAGLATLIALFDASSECGSVRRLLPLELRERCWMELSCKVH